MATLAFIRETVAALAADNSLGKEEAESRLYMLALDLLKEDEGFYIIETETGVYSDQVNAKDPQRYLRVFTDNELALACAMPKGGSVKKIDSLELLRLCKWLFLHGITHIILNEGEEAWLTFAIAQLIHVFLDAILQDPDSYSNVYTNCITLVTAVRLNSKYMLVCPLENGNPYITEDGEETSYVFSERNVLMPGKSTELMPVDIQTLFHFRGRVSISLPGLSFTAKAEDLRAALKVCGIADPHEPYIAASTFYDEPDDIGHAAGNYHEICDLRMAFQEEDYDAGITPATKPRTLVTVPAEDADVEKQAAKKRVLQRLRDSLSKIKARLKKFSCARSETSAEKRNDRTVSWFIRRYGRLMASCVVSVTLITALLVAHQMRSANQAAEFLTDLERQAYDNAYERYLGYRDTGKANAIVATAIEETVGGYANDRLTKTELDKRLQGLSVFPGQEQALENAYATAALITLSKQAYNNGAAAERAFEKLGYWADVIPLDAANYQKVRSEAAVRRGKWEKELLSRIDEYAYLDRQEAQKCVDAALCFYPDSSALQQWDEIFAEEEGQESLNSYPVKISNIHMEHDANAAVSVYLKWENSSEYAIDRVFFCFRFLDKDGEPVTYRRRDEIIGIFRGEESSAGPYEPGFVVASDTWGWSGLWKGNGDRVSDIKLTCVEIEYRNGNRDIFVTQRDLEQICG